MNNPTRIEQAEERLGLALNALAGKGGGAWDIVDLIHELINAKLEAFASAKAAK